MAAKSASYAECQTDEQADEANRNILRTRRNAFTRGIMPHGDEMEIMADGVAMPAAKATSAAEGHAHDAK